MATNLEIFNDLLGCLKYLIETTVANLESSRTKVYKKTKSLKRLNNNATKSIDQSARMLHSSPSVTSLMLKSTEIKHSISTRNTLKINFELRALVVSNHESQMSSSNTNYNHRQLTTIFKKNFADLVNFYFKMQEYYLKLQLNQVDVHSCVSAQLNASQKLVNLASQRNNNQELTQVNFDCLQVNLTDPTQINILVIYFRLAMSY